MTCTACTWYNNGENKTKRKKITIATIYKRDIHVDFSETKELMDLLKRHEFYTNKSLGQHFLISQKALAAIVSACIDDINSPILEVGPGIGVVTRALLESGANVIAVELDRRAITILAETVGDFNTVKIIENDILKINLNDIFTESEKWVVVGNLPYYITTPVITKIITHYDKISRAVFMVQKEVAERMTAEPHNKMYGSLTVFCNLFAKVKTVAKVPKGAFMPPPNVDSAVVQLDLRDKPLLPSEDIPIFSKILRAAFQQRRKQVVNCFISNLSLTRTEAENALNEANIPLTARAENMLINDYVCLTNIMKKYITGDVNDL